MKYFFDTEFIEDGVTIDLLSIGVVCEDGREFYAQNADADLDRASEWVRDNVFPGLRDATDEQILHKTEIADALVNFVNKDRYEAEFWAYYGDYDWVVLCQLFGTMMDLPHGWPMFAMDVKQLCVSLGNPRLPEQSSAEHNALNDARWTKEAFEFLSALRAAQPLTRAIELLHAFADHEDQPCSFDHHGYCQEHDDFSGDGCKIRQPTRQ